MRLHLRDGSRDDHLMIAVFVAALLHGLLILGIRFSAPPAERPLPTLEVLLVPPGENQEANLHAARPEPLGVAAEDRHDDAKADQVESDGRPDDPESLRDGLATGAIGHGGQA